MHMFRVFLVAALMFIALISVSCPPGQGLWTVKAAHASEVFQKPMNLKPSLGQAQQNIVLAMNYQPPQPYVRPIYRIRPDSEPISNQDRAGQGDLPEMEVLQLFYWPTVKEMSKRHNIDPALVMALIQVESGFNPDAVSNRGAMGLMQIVPGTAEHLGLVAPFDPEANIEAGVRYLAWLSKAFKRNTRLILAAYNAGPTKVKKSHRVPGIQSVRQYISKIQKHHWQFKRRISKLKLK